MNSWKELELKLETVLINKYKSVKKHGIVEKLLPFTCINKTAF